MRLAPVLAFLVLAAWAFASPIGSAPDDDYHLTSTWCAAGGGAQCGPGEEWFSREVAAPLVDVACFAAQPQESAACQEEVLRDWDEERVDSDRGNFVGEYPPVYYTVMHVFAGADLQVSALVMRLVNAALFTGLATALALLLPLRRRATLLWGWLVTLVPLGMFLIPSNNPSGWAVSGVGTAYLALLGAYETVGRRRIALSVLALVGVLMAAGARGDAAVYAVGAVVTATVVAAPWRGIRPSRWWRWAWVPAVAVVLAVALFSSAGQAGVAGNGFGGSPDAALGSDGEAPPSGIALLAYNVLQLPFLWTGVWGSWALGWLDTGLPALVPWAATAAFLVVAFAGIGRLDRRKALAAGGVLLVLVALPLWVLDRSGDPVGVNLQPRYLLPLIVLFAFILLTMPAGARLTFTRVQTAVVLVALAAAQLVALQVDIRRYVTGSDAQGPNLDAGAEWWWTGFPVGPTVVWIVGALAYAGLLVVLWPELRRRVPVEAEPPSAGRGERAERAL